MELKLYEECLHIEGKEKHIHNLTKGDFLPNVQEVIEYVWAAGGRVIFWNVYGSYTAIVK